MDYKVFKGLMRNSVILVKRLMEECPPALQNALEKGTLHQYLYNQVDEYLKSNGIRADRKSLNVLADLGKEMFIVSTVEDILEVGEEINE